MNEVILLDYDADLWRVEDGFFLAALVIIAIFIISLALLAFKKTR